jgi:hypothetical protein
MGCSPFEDALVALALPPSRHPSPGVAGWLTRGATDRRGARWPHRSRLSGTSVEPTSGGAVGTALAPDLCAIGVLEGPPDRFYDRPRVVKRSHDQSSLVLLSSPVSCSGPLLQMRVSSATPGYLNPGTRKGLAPIAAHGGIACTQDTETHYHGGEPAQARKGGGLRGAFPGLEAKLVTNGSQPRGHLDDRMAPRVRCVRSLPRD